MTEQWDIAQNNKNIISYSNICHLRDGSVNDKLCNILSITRQIFFVKPLN